MRGNKIKIETVIAVGELAQAAAHLHGVVGPVEFTVCRPRAYDWCGVDDDLEGDEFAEVTEEEFLDGKEL